MKVTQHFPNWADDFEPERTDVSTLAELLALPWVKWWETERTGWGPFVGWRRSDGTLLALYGEHEDHWWVVAHVPNELMAELPEWRISAAGQASVDKWNRGEG